MSATRATPPGGGPIVSGTDQDRAGEPLPLPLGNLAEGGGTGSRVPVRGSSAGMPLSAAAPPNILPGLDGARPLPTGVAPLAPVRPPPQTPAQTIAGIATSAKQAVKGRMLAKKGDESQEAPAPSSLAETLIPTDRRGAVVEKLRKAIVPDDAAKELKLRGITRLFYFLFGWFITDVEKVKAREVSIGVAWTATPRIFANMTGVTAEDLQVKPQLRVDGFDFGSDLLNLLAHVPADEVKRLLKEEIKKVIPEGSDVFKAELAERIASVAYEDLSAKVWDSGAKTPAMEQAWVLDPKMKSAIERAETDIARLTGALDRYAEELADRTHISAARLNQCTAELTALEPDVGRLLHESTNMPRMLETLKTQITQELERRAGLQRAIATRLAGLDSGITRGTLQALRHADLSNWNKFDLDGMRRTIEGLPQDSRDALLLAKVALVGRKCEIAVGLEQRRRALIDGLAATAPNELSRNQRSLEDTNRQIEALARDAGGAISTDELVAMHRDLAATISRELRRRDLEGREAAMREERVLPKALAELESHLTVENIRSGRLKVEEEQAALGALKERIERLPVPGPDIFIIEGDRTTRAAMLSRLIVLEERLR